MGLGYSTLELTEQLRPWRDNGLFFLFPGSKAPTQAASTATVQSAPDSSDQVQNTQTAPVEHRAPEQASAKAASFSKNLGPPPSWPDPWPLLWSKVRPKSQVVITFSRLAHNILGQSNAMQSQSLKLLVQALKINNICAFIPFRIPQENADIDDLPRFLAGVELTGAKTILCFGPELLKLMNLDSEPFTCSITSKGLNIWVTPSLPEDRILTEEELSRICSFLRP